MCIAASSFLIEPSLERLQCRPADVMLNSFRIPLGSLFVDPEAQKKGDDDPVAASTDLRKVLPCLGEEYGAVRFPPHQASSLEPRDVLGHGRRLHAKPLGDLDRSGLPARLDQFRDQFDVILRHLAFMCLTHGRKALSLRLGSPVDRFEWLTPL